MGKLKKLPSGRLIDVDDIIYISNIKKNVLTLEVEYSFSVLWANGQKVKFKFPDEDWCVIERNALETIIDKNTQIIYD